MEGSGFHVASGKYPDQGAQFPEVIKGMSVGDMLPKGVTKWCLTSELNRRPPVPHVCHDAPHMLNDAYYTMSTCNNPFIGCIMRVLGLKGKKCRSYRKGHPKKQAISASKRILHGSPNVIPGFTVLCRAFPSMFQEPVAPGPQCESQRLC